MPNHAKTHAEARLTCCSACGAGKVKAKLKPSEEVLIRKYAHPEYESSVESYPLGLCGGCKAALYKCRKAEEKGESAEDKKKAVWDTFKLQQIRVPRVNGDCADCPCPICSCARYKPIGVTGTKEVVLKPEIKSEGGKMECEQQSPVRGSGRGSCRGVCGVCGQVTGRGLRHPCSPGDVKVAMQGRVARGRSVVRKAEGRRKRNLTVMVGREGEEAQEQIVSSALGRIAERKGVKFRLKQMGGGGLGGQGKEVTMGAATESQPILSIEVFQEIKKTLNESKKQKAKMEEVCQILRKNKVKMTPNVKAKLKEIDHLLEDEYTTALCFTEGWVRQITASS